MVGWILFVPLAVGVLLLAIATMGFSIGGGWRWDKRISRIAKSMWAIGLSLTVAVTWAFLGTSALISAWPVWLLLFGGGGLLYYLTDLAYGVTSLPRVLRATPTAASDWNQLWRSYEGKPLPAWMLQAALQGEVRYDGKLARVVNGILVPTTPATPRLSLERVFSRLDDLLG